MAILKQAIAQYVWEMKYAYSLSEKRIDTCVEDMWQRVAKAAAGAEKGSNKRHFAKIFYHLLEDFRFLPGGRILAGAGTKHRVTLLNCFVMNIAEDSLSGIFNALSEGALTLQQGGGIGYDFSVLRPQGDLVKKTGLKAAGPVSFMRIWDTTCDILLSTGARRGAMMGVLRCDHPDIFTFIAAKKDPRALRHFNVSVMVSDDLMKAVQEDALFPLVFPAEGMGLSEEEVVYREWGHSSQPVPCRIYRYVKAKDLWQRIIQSAYEYAEPGVLFGDTINRMNNLWYKERIHATNPCGEIPLPPYGACDLGAINLTAFVLSPFSSEARLDWQGIENTVQSATRFLDNIIDIAHYPLAAQCKAAKNTRRLGLGLTGLADAMVMLGISYGSEASIVFSRSIMKKIADTTWSTSIELAEEKGVFPDYQPAYLQGVWVKTLDHDIYRDLTKKGVRNSHHNAIAPTGTISLLANNISNGIEPIFKAQYERHVLDEKGSTKTFTIQDYAYYYWREQQKEALPPAWQDTTTLTPDAHLSIQAAMQPFVDNAISKTINIPVDFPFASLLDVYTEAYKLGLKGCTVFRPNPITGSVLKAPPEEAGGSCC